MDIAAIRAMAQEATETEHQQKVTEEGWIDCDCGWESNHPHLEDGTVDPVHVGLEGTWKEHVDAKILEALTELDALADARSAE